jgi:hypothetical protein
MVIFLRVHPQTTANLKYYTTWFVLSPKYYISSAWAKMFVLQSRQPLLKSVGVPFLYGKCSQPTTIIKTSFIPIRNFRYIC